MNRLLLMLAAVMSLWGQRASEGVVDSVHGRTAEELIAIALQRNGEVLAAQQQVEAARGGLTQARLRANPSAEFNGSKEVGGRQGTLMIGGSLPLELFHRRERRMEVAEGGIHMADFERMERERQVRGEVEGKFGEVLAALRNLQFIEDLLKLNQDALGLTQARADQGAAPPLEANLLRVEVNRIDSRRAAFEATLGVSLLELKSLIGMKPEEDLQLQGALDHPLPLGMAQEEAVQRALAMRPDLLAARAAEEVANAKLKQAQTEGKTDASISASYQRMDSNFDLNGLNSAGQVRPIQGVFHYLGGGVSITLPVRNRNEGAIQMAVAQMEEARRRREYMELTVAREVMAAFLVQAKAKESLDIYSSGVRDQAGQNLDVIRQTYELGRTQLLDVIADQRRFIDIETGYTEVLSRSYQASVRVRTAAALSVGER
jgi:outer membrane protein, heavy metal efflux system